MEENDCWANAFHYAQPFFEFNRMGLCVRYMCCAYTRIVTFDCSKRSVYSSTSHTHTQRDTHACGTHRTGQHGCCNEINNDENENEKKERSTNDYLLKRRRLEAS